jgi:hypothetical protein
MLGLVNERMLLEIKNQYTPYVRAVEVHLPNIVTTVTFIFISFIFHMVVMGFSRFVFDNLLCTASYKKLTSTEKIDFDSRVVSNVHAIISSAGCIYTFAVYPEAFHHLATFWVPEFIYICSYSSGYLLADLTVVLGQGDGMMILHHVMGLCGLVSAAGAGIFAPVIIFFFGTEMTTPFINGRVFLTVFGYRDSILFVLNGLAITIGWFVIRIGSIPFFAKAVWEQWDVIQAQQMYLIAQVLLFSTLVTVLNVVWFYKILMGLINVVCGSKKPKGDSTKAATDKKKN